MPNWLVPLIVIDIFVTLIVVGVITKHIKFNVNLKVNSTGPMDIKGLIQFAKDEHERIGEYLHANYSGQPEMLPGVLSSLMDKLDADAKNRGLCFDRQTLKVLLAGAVRSHKVCKPQELQDAMEKIAA
jgi:hypothetical protein